MNYYNEFDPKAAAWLQQLIDNKQIPYGYVDPRSILEVQPSDLSGFTQCHFFAGIGGWSLALQLADWSEDRPVWTASLPCQPFSAAGKQEGTADERHLWPTFERLVRECRPPTIFGEQVASKLARTDWFPRVCLDMQALGYSATAVDICAPCSGEVGEGRIVRGDQETWERIIIGHPHIRQRLYWVADCRLADTERGRHEEQWTTYNITGRQRETVFNASRGSADDGLADSSSTRREGRVWSGETREEGQPNGHTSQRSHNPWRQVSFAADCLGGEDGEFGDECSLCGLDYCDECECPGPTQQDEYEYVERNGTLFARRMGDSSIERLERHNRDEHSGSEPRWEHPQQGGPARETGWTVIPCKDGKTRRTQSGIFPLVDGISRGVVPSGDPSDPSYANATSEARTMRLKGYGNAIVPPLAASFITAFTQTSQNQSA